MQIITAEIVVDHSARALSRIVLLLSTPPFEVDSLTLWRAPRDTVSRLVVDVRAENAGRDGDLLAKRLNRLVPITRVRIIQAEEHITAPLASQRKSRESRPPRPRQP